MTENKGKYNAKNYIKGVRHFRLLIKKQAKLLQ